MLIEYWFDFSCPYAYLGSERIEELARRTGAELRWCPMLLGGVFRAIGNHDEGSAPGKRRHNYLDMHRWAEVHDLPFTMPEGHPMRTVAALRALLSLAEDRWPAVIHGFYRAYWQRGLDPGAPETIRTVLAEAGCDETAITRALAANEDAAIKDDLRRRTDEAVARGVFGAPTMFVSGDDVSEPLMFWGQDRFDMVEAVVRGWRPGSNAPALRPEPVAARGGPAATVDFWFDFSSPFAYLGSTQIEAICGRHGATLRWRPMLLGALFKEVGAPNVPLLAMSENKRRYLGRELDYWASWWQVPFSFTRHFPLRTILPLRLALLGGDQAAVIRALYRAAWTENVNLGAEAAVAGVLTGAGQDAARIAATQDPAIKKQLADDTAAAGAAGVFGAPTTIVTWPGEAPLLFWGQDRLELVDRALGGWRPTVG